MIKKVWELLKATFEEWREDKAARLAAALGYYTIFALPPILLIVVGVAGYFLGQEAVREEVIGQVSGLIGNGAGDAIRAMIANAGSDPNGGILATIVGVVTLVIGATGVFSQLQDALNTIWEVTPKPNLGIWATIRTRFLSFTMILGIAFLLLVSLVLSAGLSAVSKYLEGLFPQSIALVQILSAVLSFAVITLLFAMMFTVLPDVKIAWSDVWLGAAVTALLFTVGKFLLGLYLGRSGAASAYGAAGSLVLILLWIYYSAQILFLGAEFTQVYARLHGSHIVPADNAVALTERDRTHQGIPHRQTVDTLVGGGGEAPVAPMVAAMMAPMPPALPAPRGNKLKRYLPAMALFAAGLALGVVFGPTEPEE